LIVICWRFFASIKLDADTRQWFVDIIKARAKGGQRDNHTRKAELRRQQDQLETKLKTLLDLRIEGEITPEDYASKRNELTDRQSALRLQLETADRDDTEVADLAIKAFELSQSLTERWVTADYAAKRTLLSISSKLAYRTLKRSNFAQENPSTCCVTKISSH